MSYLPDINSEKIAEYIREVAAERIMPRFQKLELHEISEKSGPSDLVTIADIEAERDLTRILQDALPGSLVVGEEAVSEGAASIETLRTEKDPVWVIDPVDGTNNFSRGEPVFGAMVALVYKGETVRAWIYDIPGDRMAVSEKGGGSYIGGARRRIGAPPALAALTGFVSTKFAPPAMRPVLQARRERTRATEGLMCCAHEYIALAEGARDYSMYYRLKPWDHLAGVLIHAEAGGYSRKWDGSPYLPGDDSGGIISAPAAETWHELRDLFLDNASEKK